MNRKVDNYVKNNKMNSPKNKRKQHIESVMRLFRIVAASDPQNIESIRKHFLK